MFFSHGAESILTVTNIGYRAAILKIVLPSHVRARRCHFAIGDSASRQYCGVAIAVSPPLLDPTPWAQTVAHVASRIFRHEGPISFARGSHEGSFVVIHEPSREQNATATKRYSRE